MAKMGLEPIQGAGNHQTSGLAAAQVYTRQINSVARGQEDVRDMEVDQSFPKKSFDSYIPTQTRQSSRLQDNAEVILKKAITEKSKAKCITFRDYPFCHVVQDF